MHPLFAHYCSTDLLRLQDLHTPIVYPTPWTHTGWGFRSLAVTELLSAVYLPLPLRPALMTLPIASIQLLVMSMIPLRCLSTVVDFWLHTSHLPIPCFARAAPQGVTPSATPTDQGITPPASLTWLPGLKCFLPSSWADDTFISSGAVKSDDAAVPLAIWDLRILLILPHMAPFLPLFRRCCLRRWRRNLWTDLRRYLVAEHGLSWGVDLIALRRGCGLPPVCKRIKGGGGVVFRTSRRQRRSLYLVS